MKIKSINVILISGIVVVALSGVLWQWLGSGVEEQPFTLLPYFPEGEGDYYRADVTCGHMHVSQAARSFNWPEHPAGKVMQKCNNLGFREDDDTELEKTSLRILVTGDSHTDGVVYNRESFANLMESVLADSIGERVEILNAAHGYYGPQNYLGVIRKFAYLRPDVFVVALYPGNDFLDAVLIRAENKRMVIPEMPESYYQDLWEVDAKAPGFTGQGMSQIKFFKTYPQFKDSAEVIAIRCVQRIKDYCDKQHVKLYLALIPVKIDVEPALDSARFSLVTQMLHFTDEDLGLHQQFADVLKTWSSTNEVPCLDLTSALKATGRENFWRADHHLNHHGHAAVAKAIASDPVFIGLLK